MWVKNINSIKSPAQCHGQTTNKCSEKECAEKNQICTEGFSQPCMNKLCTTYKSKCPDPATVRYASVPGCICKDGWALIEPGECAEVGSAKCPAVAAKTDCRFYRSNLLFFLQISNILRIMTRICADEIHWQFKHSQFRAVAPIQIKCMRQMWFWIRANGSCALHISGPDVTNALTGGWRDLY